MKLTHLKAYVRVWLKLTTQQFQSQVANSRGAAALFIFGKLFRLGTAFLMIYVIIGRAKLIAGYDLSQAVFILALFNLISSLTQLFMRGIYVFRQKVVDGTFDFYLLNPLSELFYSLFSYTDPLDLILFEQEAPFYELPHFLFQLRQCFRGEGILKFKIIVKTVINGRPHAELNVRIKLSY